MLDQGYIRERVTITETGCWDWTAQIDKLGYGRTNTGYRHFGEALAHRLSWVLFNGGIPQFNCVCHKCDNRRCVNPNHLFLGSQYDNVTDSITKGRSPQFRSTIPPEIKQQIKAEYVRGVNTIKQLALKYNVSYKVAYKAVNNLY